MENKFLEVMSQRTDEELIKILTVERRKYNPLAIEAAELEIEKRNIDTSDFEKVREKVTIEKQEEEQVYSNIAGSVTRFLNLIIDTVIWYVLIIITFFIINLFIPFDPSVSNLFIILFNLILIFGVFFAYHSIMEIKFQKTVGKFVTKTKVVKMNGEKPTNNDIITRTFCRLIPFDRLSFVFVKIGIHDFLSKTTVVKD
ncbi:RDD family protein [Aquimarina sp. U1-2]|uniref:RDD family protein n=1 Tax=Aquimarina sp. U1-2 TaxID=2823141 RepID=UPI001AECE74F|nr:RDD family protein [Aquimarina sp. U1-2]MBP2831563.1 RDD family protein [Aquimarina sp. U1-2]